MNMCKKICRRSHSNSGIQHSPWQKTQNQPNIDQQRLKKSSTKLEKFRNCMQECSNRKIQSIL
uniref:Heat shock factor-binding protein 1-like n=1 Tax=Rhizophora mucronata TaxID=61149 RepID=A0A2P2JKR3_RHIMU